MYFCFASPRFSWRLGALAVPIKSFLVGLVSWRFKHPLSLLTVCFIAATANAGDTAALDRFFSGLRTFSAHFEQTIVDAKGQTTQNASGRLSIQRPGKFRWDYDQPYKQMVLGDGQQLWTYDADLEQATVKPQSDALAGTPALLLSAQEQPGELFSIEALPARDGEQWFELKPKGGENVDGTQFNRLRLGFMDAMLVAMELVDAFDQTTLIRFSETRRNGALQDGSFTFIPPEGVDVIGTVPE